MNFGETLAYWYLRLNGFFPITNFVVHQGEIVKRSADADLLAVRFPFVYEEIGGQEDDWAQANFGAWGLDLNRDILGMIVEVKTGYDDAPGALEKAVQKPFNIHRLTYAVPRLGFWQRHKVEHIVTELAEAPYYRDPESNFVVAKLLISQREFRDGNVPPCLWLSMKDIERFIVARMDAYIERKYGDRMFFPDELIQYIIWSRQNRD